jgi:hypothetical protein
VMVCMMQAVAILLLRSLCLIVAFRSAKVAHPIGCESPLLSRSERRLSANIDVRFCIGPSARLRTLSAGQLSGSATEAWQGSTFRSRSRESRPP